MVKTNIKTTRYIDYNHGKGLWVDVVDLGNEFEAWLTPIEYGVSRLMFGSPKEQSNGEHIDYDKFMELVNDNLEDYAEGCEEWAY